MRHDETVQELWAAESLTRWVTSFLLHARRLLADDFCNFYLKSLVNNPPRYLSLSNTALVVF
jgi:hypothetical protein